MGRGTMTKVGRKRRMVTFDGEDTLDWLTRQNLSALRGLWIVALNRKIVAKAETLEKALNQARLPPDVVPLVVRVPTEEQLTV